MECARFAGAFFVFTMTKKEQNMKKRKLTLILTAILPIICCLVLSACGDTLSIAKTEVNELGELVVTYTNGTSENLGKVTGENGKDGTDGETPTVEIDEDGYWVINGEKTDIKAKGDFGESAYEAYLKLHPEYTKSEEEWLEDLTNGKLHTEEPVPILGEFEFATNGSNSYYIVSYTGNDKFVHIPATYNGYPVTEIGKEAFKDNSVLEEVLVPTNIKVIETSAFNGCSNLKSINIPDSVERIGYEAFRNCTSLTSITIPDGVTSIDNYAFSYCTRLTSITIPDSVESIGTCAFYSCTSLTSVTIGNSVESIGYEAFRNCTSLTSITIPDSVTSIGYYAFYSCDSLTSVTIGDSVTRIGEYAFYSCDSLTSITIPDSVTSIGNYAFEYCYTLVEVINQSSLNIEAGSEDYGEVGYYAIEVHQGESKIVNYNDYLFYTYNGVNYLLGYIGTDAELTLPESYNGEDYEIYKYAFRNCTSLTSITIPDSVTSIGNYAFSYCTRLTSITIPDSVTSIGYYAFYNCDSLTSITIPDSVESIGNSAFSYCRSLTSITIPDRVTSIGSEAFYLCTSLTSIKYRGTKDQWNDITKGSGWNSNTGSYKIEYEYDGE